MAKIPKVREIEKRIFWHTNRWVVQGGVGVPFGFVIPAEAITHELKKRYPAFAASKVISVAEKGGDRAYWIFDEDEFIETGMWAFKSPKFIKKAYKEWQQDAKNYYACIRDLHKKGIQNIQTEFKRFLKLYIREYSLPLITEYISLAGDVWVQRLFKKYGWSEELKANMEVLTRSPYRTFLQEADLHLLKLVHSLENRKLPSSVKIFAKDFNKEMRMLVSIQKKFFWIHFNYRDTVPLTNAFFYSRVLQFHKLTKLELLKRIHRLAQCGKKHKQEVAKVRRTTKLTVKEQKALQLIGFAAHWQDQRKAANLIGNYWCNEFLKHIAPTSQVTLSHLQHLIPSELIAYFRSGNIPKTELRERFKGSLHVIFLKGDEYIFSGATYRRIWKRIYHQNHPGKVVELRGICASPGKYIGTVRRIENPAREGKNLKQGDILMTYMTRPDFIPFMKRAGAIVTDEGGLTSHAAIIARELNVPCVVGTRFAMRTFRNGEKIEVDANDGVVRKIS